MHSSRKAKYNIDSESNTEFNELTLTTISISSMTNRSAHFLKYVAHAQQNVFIRKSAHSRNRMGLVNLFVSNSTARVPAGPLRPRAGRWLSVSHRAERLMMHLYTALKLFFFFPRPWFYQNFQKTASSTWLNSPLGRRSPVLHAWLSRKAGRMEKGAAASRAVATSVDGTARLSPKTWNFRLSRSTCWRRSFYHPLRLRDVKT